MANSFLKLFMVVVMKNINKDLINIRLANIYDLAELKMMYDKIVVNMHKNGINMWNDVYPYICFEERINNKNLYVMTYENEIIASFSLVNSIEDAEDFKWSGDKALYLGTVGVNVEFLKQGIGQLVIENSEKIAKSKGFNYLRLDVNEINIPAINLYKKCGFKQVEGESRFFSEILNKEIVELGFEKCIIFS